MKHTNKESINQLYFFFQELINQEAENSFDLEILKEQFDQDYFSKVLSNNSPLKNEYANEESRGFGGEDIFLNIDQLISLFKILLEGIALDIAIDASKQTVYMSLLKYMEKMPAKKIEKYQPWAEKLYKFLKKEVE